MSSSPGAGKGLGADAGVEKENQIVPVSD
ncbi:hypothetical protein OOU_Y34scaffold00192g35 [Pyricularia oryzae Y34]|uniref:Uncharacterized protein n=2 Tax=Pyricularia oryzae TaxID=318829 RepID=A0AA97P6L9_PYRO3|nr:hypothetical protein OOU_Y34scaffold00192g35 [Pyricularia oryzae Y34]